jgi:hypothetical protein
MPDDPNDAAPAVTILSYARSRPKSDTAVWIVIALVSIGFQCFLAHRTYEAVQRGRAGVVTINASPRAFGRLLDPDDVARVTAREHRFIAWQWAFIGACMLVAAASACFIVAILRAATPLEISVIYRRSAAAKIVLTILWIIVGFAALEQDRHLWNGLSRHVPIDSGPPFLEAVAFLIVGLVLSRQLRRESRLLTGA